MGWAQSVRQRSTRKWPPAPAPASIPGRTFSRQQAILAPLMITPFRFPGSAWPGRPRPRRGVSPGMAAMLPPLIEPETSSPRYRRLPPGDDVFKGGPVGRVEGVHHLGRNGPLALAAHAVALLVSDQGRQHLQGMDPTLAQGGRVGDAAACFRGDTGFPPPKQGRSCSRLPRLRSRASGRRLGSMASHTAGEGEILGGDNLARGPRTGHQGGAAQARFRQESSWSPGRAITGPRARLSPPSISPRGGVGSHAAHSWGLTA